MCAINGFNFGDEALVRRMNKATAHRGPDGTGFFADQGVSLGHNRLSIIDLSAEASQPMRDANGDLVIVFNGEIYNYQELRQGLENSYKFRTKSDTEVILAAYRKWGSGCLEKFNGIFALAIWDKKRQELFLARDRQGIKPLYYFWDGKKLIFSSEIKGILAHSLKREIDWRAFNFFFRLLYIPEPLSPIKGISKLPAANFAVFRQGQLEIKKYWQVEDFENLNSRQEAKEKIRNIFDSAVKYQLISDRPVGVFLSGGLDSSAVVGSVARQTAEKVKTFSVGFEVADQSEKFNADFDLAQKTAEFYQTEHHSFQISAKDVLNVLPQVTWHLDEPNANPTAAAIFLLSREAKREVAVVLGGDGADELFGGYPRYFLSQVLGLIQILPQSLRQFLASASPGSKVAEKLLLEVGADQVLSFISTKEYQLAEIIQNEVLNSEFLLSWAGGLLVETGDFEKTFMDFDRRTWLTDESLLRTDRMSMAHGLEERVPILDHRLVELSAKIPTSWKLGWNFSPKNFQGKRIWKEAVRDYLPPHLLGEPKRGWFTPMAKWLRADLRDFAESVLKELPADVFKKEGVRKMWQDHLSKKRYNLNLIWALISWQLWYDRCFKA